MEEKDNNKTFIKILDPDVAQKLIEMGYTPIKEQKIYCFPYNNELLALLNTEFASKTIVVENTLTF